MTDAPDKVDRALLAMRTGKEAEATLAEGSLSEMSQSVDDRLFAKLTRGEVLTPEEAHQAWLEKFAYFRLSKKLRTLSRIGHRAAVKAGPEFDLHRTSSV